MTITGNYKHDVLRSSTRRWCLDVRRTTPFCMRLERSGRSQTVGSLFFAYFSLANAKKSTSPAGAKPGSGTQAI